MAISSRSLLKWYSSALQFVASQQLPLLLTTHINQLLYEWEKNSILISLTFLLEKRRADNFPFVTSSSGIVGWLSLWWFTAPNLVPSFNQYISSRFHKIVCKAKIRLKGLITLMNMSCFCLKCLRNGMWACNQPSTCYGRKKKLTDSHGHFFPYMVA